MRGRVESEFELGIKCFDTIINYRFFQKLKLLGNDEFNHLTNILTRSITDDQEKKYISSSVMSNVRLKNGVWVLERSCEEEAELQQMHRLTSDECLCLVLYSIPSKVGFFWNVLWINLFK